MDDTAARRAAFRRGQRGELLAALALMCKGYRILARRYRAPGGEIDLIARRGRLIAMVEVKCRPSLGEAMLAVGPYAERRIEAAADHWLARRPDHARLTVRFDLVAILPRRWPVHLERAWDARR